jgi:hypothetical protein
MKIAGARTENKGLISKEAIFMHSGEPKAHDICAQDDSERAQNDSLEEFFRSLFSDLLETPLLFSLSFQKVKSAGSHSRICEDDLKPRGSSLPRSITCDQGNGRQTRLAGAHWGPMAIEVRGSHGNPQKYRKRKSGDEHASRQTLLAEIKECNVLTRPSVRNPGELIGSQRRDLLAVDQGVAVGIETVGQNDVPRAGKAAFRSPCCEVSGAWRGTHA